MRRKSKWQKNENLDGKLSGFFLFTPDRGGSYHRLKNESFADRLPSHWHKFRYLIFLPMASPQLENGYLQIANELVQALCKTTLNQNESKVFWAILKQTYGYHKKEDKISLSQFQKLTGLFRCSISRALKSLIAKKIITRNPASITNDTTPSITNDTTSKKIAKTTNPNIVASYCIQKNYDKWIVVKSTHRNWASITNDTTPLASITNDTRSSITNDTKSGITNDTHKKYKINLKIYSRFFEDLWARYPNKDGKKAALRHFEATVKTDQDLSNIKLALDNYLNSKRVMAGFVKNGSTWFNNWQDWVEKKEEDIWLS